LLGLFGEVHENARHASPNFTSDLPPSPAKARTSQMSNKHWLPARSSNSARRLEM